MNNTPVKDKSSTSGQTAFWKTKARWFQNDVPDLLKNEVLKRVHTMPYNQACIKSISSTRQKFFCLDNDRNAIVSDARQSNLLDSREKLINAFVIIHHFTGMAQAFPCKHQSSL